MRGMWVTVWQIMHSYSGKTFSLIFYIFFLQFLGDIEVEQPKGIEVVKQGVQKLKFNQQLKKAESGSGSTKMPKMELTISVNGVTIQEPKSKKVMHEYPLHRISYCADDKEEKRFFSFIAKDEHSNKHTCFVFLSDKLVRFSILPRFLLLFTFWNDSWLFILTVDRRAQLLFRFKIGKKNHCFVQISEAFLCICTFHVHLQCQNWFFREAA